MKPTTIGQVGGTSPAIIGHAGGTNTIEKHKKIGCKNNFSCKLCKEDNLTYLCPVPPDAQRVWA